MVEVHPLIDPARLVEIEAEAVVERQRGSGDDPRPVQVVVMTLR
jgi:hypothetical protein